MIKTTRQFYAELPIQSPKMDDIGVYFENRLNRDNCKLAFTMNVANGNVQGITVTGEGTCTPVVTVTKNAQVTLPGADARAVTLSNTATSVNSEKYGTDTNVYFSITPTTPKDTIAFAFGTSTTTITTPAAPAAPAPAAAPAASSSSSAQPASTVVPPPGPKPAAAAPAVASESSAPVTTQIAPPKPKPAAAPAVSPAAAAAAPSAAPSA